MTKRTILFLVGVPGSGKSTFAKELVRKDPSFKRINKDDLRYMLHDEDFKKFDREKEKFIVRMRDVLLVQALDAGFNVVIDDTNIEDKHWQRVQEVAWTWSSRNSVEVTVEKKVFETTLDECLERNAKRTGPARVPNRVIKDMHKKLTAGKRNRKYRAYVLGLPECVVTDADGTASLLGDRNPYSKHVLNDEPNEPVMRLLLEQQALGVPIVVTSARKESAREETVEWFHRRGVRPTLVLMRQEDDNRNDAIVKVEIYEREIFPRFNVKFVLDDRNRVVDAIRDLGVPVFQVAFGDF